MTIFKVDNIYSIFDNYKLDSECIEEDIETILQYINNLFWLYSKDSILKNQLLSYSYIAVHKLFDKHYFNSKRKAIIYDIEKSYELLYQGEVYKKYDFYNKVVLERLSLITGQVESYGNYGIYKGNETVTLFIIDENVII